MNDNTKAIRDQIDRSSYREHSVPVYLTSSFVYESAEHAEAMFAGKAEGDIYSRFTNPNTTELVSKFCHLEGAEDGVVTASGMAAIFTTLAAHLQKGDNIIACSSLFGNTTYIIKNILPEWGINFTMVDVCDTDGWKAAITDQTKLVMIETPTNPGLEIIDIEWIAGLCKATDTILCVDNCFATPILQKPLQLGADIVIHSATKWIDGQGRVLGGIIVGSKELIQPVYDFLRRTGACLSPFNAWLLSKSTETLEVRMERHCQTAEKLAVWLESHDKVKSVHYPFLSSHPQYQLAKRQMSMGGGIITIDLKGSKNEAFSFLNNLTIPSLTANLGDSRTIITHPSSTTHSKLNVSEQERANIYPSTLRISVGLEHIQDLKSDIDQALNDSFGKAIDSSRP